MLTLAYCYPTTPVGPSVVPRSGIADRLKQAAAVAGQFVYETPVWVVACLVAGVALLFFLPYLAAPFLALASCTLLARLAIKILNGYNEGLVKKFTTKLHQFQCKYSYIAYIAALIAGLVAPFSVIAGAILGGVLGLYKGAVVEIEIFKYRQAIKREELKAPLHSSVEKIILA